MKIASWNINSVRLRLPLIKQLLAHTPLDVLCLQETKTPDEFFPVEALKAMGFPYLACRGEKGYNGVAILSKVPLTNDISQTFGGIDHKRHISVVLPDGTALHNFYIPAGGDISDVNENPKFGHKLQFVKDMTAWSAKRAPKDSAIIVGDFNIAPLEHDVWSHKQLLKIVSHTPIEVELLTALQHSGNWVDSHRYFTPEPTKLYSWWSYRAKDWAAADKGRRLDHIWVSPTLEGKLKSTQVVKEARGWNAPSDHVPIITELK